MITEQYRKTISGPQQFSPTFDLTHAVDVATGENAHVGIEIYGFPEPKTLILLRMLDSKDLTSSVRHSVRYTASEAPFGFVNVTFSDLLDTDLTNYTLIVDNGEGAALTYTFYLNEGERSFYSCINIHIFI